MAKAIDIVGKTFGSLTVLERVENNKNRQAVWLCQCACGKRKEVVGVYLATGHTKTCGCRSGIKINRDDIYSGVGNLSGVYWGILKKSAANRKIKFEIEKEYAWSLFVSQGGICAISGEKIELDRPFKYNQSASLDRIDSDGDYTVGNVQWVHSVVNKMKLNLQQTEFFNFCRKVRDHNETKK